MKFKKKKKLAFLHTNNICGKNDNVTLNMLLWSTLYTDTLILGIIVWVFKGMLKRTYYNSYFINPRLSQDQMLRTIKLKYL